MEYVMPLALELKYSDCVESQMRDSYQALGEKEKRRYAAIEAFKLPHGGIRYFADVLGCCEKTIALGMNELESLRNGDPLEGRQRAEGGGRPKKR